MSTAEEVNPLFEELDHVKCKNIENCLCGVVSIRKEKVYQI